MEVDKRPAKPRRRNAPAVAAETEIVESTQVNMDDRATGSDDLMSPFLEADRIDSLEIPVLPEPLMNFDGSGPRLLITHIVNENFKSYAGRHAIGPFHKNFTAIVGPNGSGKSNVIDSLLFVFGYRAQKIRSKKISVLIHNSENHPDINSCTVEIHFVKAIDKNDHEYDVIDGSNFFVSRTAYKNGSSEYSLNGRKVPFKDIGALLRGCGIDLDHNRFLILQGEVEQIALMKPKALQDGDDGMLEYLEDIIGSSRLVPYIEGLNKKCEELNEVRTEKVNRVKVVEAEKLELEETKNAAVEYLLLENEIIRKKNLLYHLYMLKADDNCKEMDVGLGILRKEYAEQEQNMKDIKKDIHAKKERYLQSKRAFDQCSSEAEKHHNLFAEMDKEDTKAREDLKHCFNKIKKLKTQLEADTKKLDDLKAAPEKAEADIAKLNARMAELEENIPQLENKFAGGTAKLRKETSDIQSKKEEAETALAAFQKQVNDARSKVDIAQGELDICTSAQKRESDKLNELNTKLSSLIESRSTKKELITKSKKQFKELEMNFQDTQTQIREVTNQEAMLSDEIRNDRTKVEEAKIAMQSCQGRGAVLSALLEERRKGTIQGIIGRLGDLAAIDEKYDVAISTACGPLDNIVVDTIDTAQQCVNFLKKRNLGQATFIGLDKMTKFSEAMRQSLETPENVPRLFDLIRVEDELVLPAFYFALRDTLVAPNLDQATRIALQGRVRWRVVTLQGQLLDPSGTMSGGGNKQMKGRMGSSVVAHAGTDMKREDIEKLDKKMEQLSQQLNAKRQKRLELEKNLDQISRESQKLKILIDKTTAELEASNKDESILSKQIANQEKVLNNTVIDENEKKRLQKRVDELTKEYDRVYQSGEEIRAKVAKYHEKIMEISDRLVGSVQKQLDECRNELENCRKNITKSNVSVKTAQRNFKKTEEQIEKCQQELQESEVTKEMLKNKRKKLETEGVKVMDAFEQAKENAKKLEEDCIREKKELDSAEEVELQLSKTAMDKKQRLETSESALKEQTHKLNHWKKEIKKLKLNDLRDLKPISNAKKTTPVKKAKRRKGKTQEADENSRSGDAENEKSEEIDDSNNGDDDDEDQEKEMTAIEDQQETCSDFRFDEVDLPTPEEKTLRKMQEKAIVVTLTVDEDNLKSMKPNLGAIDDFRKKLEKYNACVQDLEEVTNFRDKVRLKFDEFRKRRLTEFMTGFRTISTRLKEMYQMITLGGDADLDLVDTMDPFSEGIVFSVRPPKKSWKQISNLSGGEKTLSSLALVFALHHYKPTPLYVMDEIDAALDFKNVSIVANYIKERTKNAQFIIISLRNNMFELCDRLIGIYKTYNCTKSVTFDPEKVALKPAVKKNHSDQFLARKLNVDPPIAEKTAAEDDLQVLSPSKRQRITEN